MMHLSIYRILKNNMIIGFISNDSIYPLIFISYFASASILIWTYLLLYVSIFPDFILNLIPIFLSTSIVLLNF